MSILTEHDIKHRINTMDVNLSGTGQAECRCFKTGNGTIMIDRVEWELIDQKQDDIARLENFFPENQ